MPVQKPVKVVSPMAPASFMARRNTNLSRIVYKSMFLGNGWHRVVSTDNNADMYQQYYCHVTSSHIKLADVL